MDEPNPRFEDEDLFRHWLTELPEEEIFNPRWPCQCPIGLWHKEVIGYSLSDCYYGDEMYTGPDDPPDPWYKRYFWSAYQDPDNPVQTPSQALDHLNRVLEGTEVYNFEEVE